MPIGKLQGLSTIVGFLGFASAISTILLMRNMEFQIKAVNENKKPKAKRLDAYLKFTDHSYIR